MSRPQITAKDLVRRGCFGCVGVSLCSMRAERPGGIRPVGRPSGVWRAAVPWV